MEKGGERGMKMKFSNLEVFLFCANGECFSLPQFSFSLSRDEKDYVRAFDIIPEVFYSPRVLQFSFGICFHTSLLTCFFRATHSSRMEFPRVNPSKSRWHPFGWTDTSHVFRQFVGSASQWNITKETN